MSSGMGCSGVLLCPAIKVGMYREAAVRLSAGQRGHLATRSGQNVLKAEKLTSSIRRKPNEMEPWSVLNVNRKSYDAYDLP